MPKTDLKKELKHLYSPSAKEVALVEVPEMNFLMVDGAGDPNSSPAFQEAVEALYGVSYTLKFSVKKGGGPDYAVAPLEGLWWMDDPKGFDVDKKDQWKWTLMIAQPDFITSSMVEDAVKQVKGKKDSPSLAGIRFDTHDEGAAVQIMHIGPYAEEGPTIAKLHDFSEQNGYELTRKHHEIYLSDPRRCAPEKMKTILRHPVRVGQGRDELK